MPVALVALPAIIEGLMALLVIIGGALLIEYVGRAIGIGIHIPGLSFAINWVINATNGALRAMEGFLDATVRGVVSAITAIPVAISNLIGAIEAFAWAHWSWLHTLITDTIPRLWDSLWTNIANIYHYFNAYIAQIYNSLVGYIDWVERYLNGVISQVESALVSYIGQIEAYILQTLNSAIASVTAYALGLYNSAISYIESIYNTLSSYIAAQVARLEAYAVSLANWAIQQAVSIAEQYAKQYADWAIDVLLNTLTFGTATALAPAWPRVIDAIDAIGAAIPGVLEDILDDIRALPRVLPLSIPGILAALLGAAAVAIEYVARCGVDICKNLHGFGDEVAGLNDAVLTAGMIAFIVAAVESPEATARETDAIGIEPLVDVGKGFADVIGTVF